MATEIVTPYPLPAYRLDSFQDVSMMETLRRLAAIEERLSRIEEEIGSAQVPPTE